MISIRFSASLQGFLKVFLNVKLMHTSFWEKMKGRKGLDIYLQFISFHLFP